MPWAETILDGLWRSAVAVIPLAIIVALVCRFGRLRSGTRHALWLATLLGLLVLPLLPAKSDALNVETETASHPGVVSDRDEFQPTLSRFDVQEADEPVDDDAHDAIAARDGFSNRLENALWRESHTEDEFAEAESTNTASDSARMVSREFALDLPAPTKIDPQHLASHALVAVVDWMLSRDVAAAPAVNGDETDPQPNPVAYGHSPIANDSSGLRSQTAPKSEWKTDSSTTGSAAVVDSEVQSDGPKLVAWIEDSQSRKPSRFAAMVERWTNSWAAWAGQLSAVRDAAGRVSPIPVSLWLCGSLIVVLVHVVASMRLRRRIVKSRAAPRYVQRIVADVSKQIGLRQPPRCVFVRQRLSPMIWCGLRKCLVLPADLWMDLDEASRRAVITHELAHLRRRDHWVRWIDLVVGCVYWWHPVVWWVRARVNAEAEECCDAWVTWLNPKERRAYATALLTARSFMSAGGRGAPVVGMGARTQKQNSFARRLTMVMTRKENPGISLSGMVLVAALLLTGWVATPAHSDPPDADDSGATLVVTSGDGQYVVADAKDSGDAKRKVYVVSDRDDDEDEDDEVEDRIERLEKQMTKLMRMIEQKERKSRGSEHFFGKTPPAPKAPKSPKAPKRPKAHDLRFSGAKVARTYKLSEEKMDALTELMIRDDVPILVSPGKGEISVQATPEQHAVFARFVRLIDDERKQKHELSGGKLDALSKLMIRNDVPVFVAPGHDHITVTGSPEQQHIFANFVRMIQGEEVRDVYAGAGFPQGLTYWKGIAQSNPSQAHKIRELAAQDALRHIKGDAAHQLRQTLKTDRSGLRKQLRELRRHAREMTHSRKGMEMQADQLREKAERLQEAAEELRREADEMREQVDNESDAARARALLTQLASLEDRADDQAFQGDEVFDQVEAISAAAEGMDWQIDALESQCDSLESALESWPVTVSSAASVWPHYDEAAHSATGVGHLFDDEPAHNHEHLFGHEPHAVEHACPPAPCAHPHEPVEPAGLSESPEPAEPTEVEKPAKPADLAVAR